jgi:tripartite-type tricarboxylate transporter receptor subunit TctC
MRTFIVALLACASSLAIAQQPASKVLRIVVPYGSAGSPDLVARTFAQKLTEGGQQAIVENRPGAGGILAAEIVIKAPADGYTLFLGDSQHYAISQVLREKFPYHPLKDFTPVIEPVAVQMFLAVGAGVPAKSAAELVSLAKARPDGVPYGSSGVGSPHHMAGELLRQLSGAPFRHIPYKGVAQSVPAVLSSEVDAVFAGLPPLQGHVKAGKIRLLAVASLRRASYLPEIPTLAESGFAEFDVPVSVGVLARAGTPPELVQKLNSELARIMKLPDVTARLAGLGMEVVAGTPEQFGASIQYQLDTYTKLVARTGAKAE